MARHITSRSCAFLFSTFAMTAGALLATVSLAGEAGRDAAVDVAVVDDSVQPRLYQRPVEQLRSITPADAAKIEVGKRRISPRVLADMGMTMQPEPAYSAAQVKESQNAGNRRGANNSTRGSLLSDPTGQTFSISSSTIVRFDPMLFEILDFADPNSGQPGHDGAVDDVFTIGVPGFESGRAYRCPVSSCGAVCGDAPSIPMCKGSIIAYDGANGRATFQSLRHFSDDYAPGERPSYGLYPYCDLDLSNPNQDVDHVVWALGQHDLLAWQPQTRVVNASFAIRSDSADPWYEMTGLEALFNAPFHGPDVLLFTGAFAFIGQERVTLDIQANAGPFEDPPCPFDIVPNDGSGAHAGRVGDGRVSVSDILAVLTTFESGSFPPRAIGDVTPAGGDGAQTLADVTAVLGAFGEPCPVYDNDDCAQARTITIVSEGTTEFSNVNATTDGPDHGTGDGNACDIFGSGDIVRDVWFQYTVSCDELSSVTIDTLGSNWDTKLAVYDATGGCPVDESNLLGCNDDSPFNAFTLRSVVTLQNLQPGTTLLIRVGGSPAAPGGEGNTPPPPPLPGDPRGGFNGTTGYDGLLTISCSP